MRLSKSDIPFISSIEMKEIVLWHMMNGVKFASRDSVYIGPAVTIGKGTFIWPGVVLLGQTHIGENCELGPHAVLEDVTVGDGATIHSFNYLRHSRIGKNAEIWPSVTMYQADIEDSTVDVQTQIHRSCRIVWTRIRAGCNLEQNCEFKYIDVGQNCRICHSIITGEKLPDEELAVGKRTIHIGESCTIGPWVYIWGQKDIPPNMRVVAPHRADEYIETVKGATHIEPVM